MASINDYHAREIVLSSIGPVLIDTNMLSENSYETIVVKCDQNGANINWRDPLESDWYANKKEARIGHATLVSKWEV